MACGNKDIRIGKLKLEESNHLETLISSSMLDLKLYVNF